MKDKNVAVPYDQFEGLHTPTKKSLATLDGEIVVSEITVKLEMRDVLKVRDAQT